MEDWIGLGVIILMIVAAYAGLRHLSRTKVRDNEEFERRAAESYSAVGATVNALQEVLDPGSAKAKTAVVEMNAGRHSKKRREAKATNETKAEKAL